MKKDYTLYIDVYLTTMMKRKKLPRYWGKCFWTIKFKKDKDEAKRFFKHLIKHISAVEGHHGIEVKRQKKWRSG